MITDVIFISGSSSRALRRTADIACVCLQRFGEMERLNVREMRKSKLMDNPFYFVFASQLGCVMFSDAAYMARRPESWDSSCTHRWLTMSMFYSQYWQHYYHFLY